MPHKDPEQRRAYQRARILTPEQKARKAARAKARREAPKVRAALLANCRKRRARMTEAEKDRIRKKARERMREIRSDPVKREAINKRWRERDRRIRENQNFELPDAMICACPDCERLAIHDTLGQTGLCPDHNRQSGHYLTRR